VSPEDRTRRGKRMFGPVAEVPTRGPGAAGCLLGLAALASFLFLGSFLFIFLDSGADRGEVTLLDQRAYGRGTVTHLPEHGFFLVRLEAGFLALADLDAANRAAAGRRCRVHTVTPGSPAADAILARFAARVTSAAEGAGLLLAEDCRGAVYDVAGIRVDGDGPNLDRYEVATDARGRVVVLLQVRTCSAREGNELALRRDC